MRLKYNAPPGVWRKLTDNEVAALEFLDDGFEVDGQQIIEVSEEFGAWLRTNDFFVEATPEDEARVAPEEPEGDQAPDAPVITSPPAVSEPDTLFDDLQDGN